MVSTVVVLGEVAGAPPAAAAATDDAPLKVTMDTLTPSVIPRRGTVTVTGEVTNRSESDWLDLQAYLFVSGEPIGGEAELAEAAATDPRTEVGSRLATEGLFTELGDLAPGATTTYSVTVRRDDLDISGEPGVYWIGVHVLGAGDGGRDGVADGRARTFIPLMPRATSRAQLALTVPLRQEVRRDPDNRLLNLSKWQRTLAPEGRLERVLSFGASSLGPITWVVDPAVLDAAASVAEDNPALATGDDGSGPAAEGEPSPSPGTRASRRPPAPRGPPSRASPTRRTSRASRRRTRRAGWAASGVPPGVRS